MLDGRPLAYHCQDLAMWFDNIDLAAQSTGGVPTARALAAKMSGALVAFARTGNPNHAGIPKWPAYSAVQPGQHDLRREGRGADGSGQGGEETDRRGGDVVISRE